MTPDAVLFLRHCPDFEAPLANVPVWRQALYAPAMAIIFLFSFCHRREASMA
jgi:hypothetical protein